MRLEAQYAEKLAAYNQKKPQVTMRANLFSRHAPEEGQ